MFMTKNLQRGLEENVSTYEKKVNTQNDVPLIYTYLHVHAIVLCIVVIVVGHTFADTSLFAFSFFSCYTCELHCNNRRLYRNYNRYLYAIFFTYLYKIL